MECCPAVQRDFIRRVRPAVRVAGAGIADSGERVKAVASGCSGCSGSRQAGKLLSEPAEDAGGIFLLQAGRSRPTS